MLVHEKDCEIAKSGVCTCKPHDICEYTEDIILYCDCVPPTDHDEEDNCILLIRDLRALYQTKQ